MTMRPDNLCASKYDGEISTGQTFSFQKGEIRRKKGMMCATQVQRLLRQMSLDSEAKE